MLPDHDSFAQIFAEYLLGLANKAVLVLLSFEHRLSFTSFTLSLLCFHLIIHSHAHRRGSA